MGNKAKKQSAPERSVGYLISVGESILNRASVFTLVVQGVVSREFLLGILADLKVCGNEASFSRHNNETVVTCSLLNSGVDYLWDSQQLPDIRQAWCARIKRNFLGWTWLKEDDRLVLRFQLGQGEGGKILKEPEEQILSYFSRVRAITFHGLNDLTLAVDLQSAEVKKHNSQLWLIFQEKGEYNGNG